MKMGGYVSKEVNGEALIEIYISIVYSLYRCIRYLYTTIYH